MRLGAITIVVDDYDKALDFYIKKLGFLLVEDTPVEDKRWVVISPSEEAQTHIVLAVASTEEQKLSIGRQAGERVWLFLHVTHFDKAYERMQKAGVQFLEEPRNEAYGRVAVFQDCYGNKWDLIQRY